MTKEEKIARRKLTLELAADLGNVSKDCKLVGYSHQQFYQIRRNFQTYGAAGLIDRLPGPRGPHPNRLPEPIETAILDYAVAHPCHAPMRVAHELALQGVHVSSSDVRGVWQRHGLLTRHDRLLRREKGHRPRRTCSSATSRYPCSNVSARSSASGISRPRTRARWSP